MKQVTADPLCANLHWLRVTSLAGPGRRPGVRVALATAQLRHPLQSTHLPCGGPIIGLHNARRPAGREPGRRCSLPLERSAGRPIRAGRRQSANFRPADRPIPARQVAGRRAICNISADGHLFAGRADGARRPKEALSRSAKRAVFGAKFEPTAARGPAARSRSSSRSDPARSVSFRSALGRGMQNFASTARGQILAAARPERRLAPPPLGPRRHLGSVI